MWRVLIQLPTLISEVIGHLRTISFLTQQSVLLQQETNLLLRELIVKVTTQPADTPEAVRLDESWKEPAQPPIADLAKLGRTRQPREEKPPRVLTEHDIIRNTRTTIAEEQFKQRAAELYPHRKGEQLPTSPHKAPTTSTRPIGPPGA